MDLSDQDDSKLADYICAQEKLELLTVHLIAHGISKIQGKCIATEDECVNKLYRACIYALENRGLLLSVHDSKTLGVDPSRVKPIKELSTLKRECLALAPSIASHIQLLLHCAEHLPAVLVGKTSGLEVIFPQGEAKLVSEIYRANELQDWLNTQMANTIVAASNRRGETSRILEIGAGTCATTEPVLERFSQGVKCAELVVSDISTSLATIAEQRFSQHYPFSTYRMLDIEKPQHDHFDVIYASNVLHATSNIEIVIDNIVSMMKYGGTLIINELMAFSCFTTITFGMTPGWWLYKDTLRLPHSPLLDGKGWKEILRGKGFTNIEIVYPNTERMKYASQAMIVSEWYG